MKKLTEAIKEARAAVVRDPVGLLKKALKARKEYKIYKSSDNDLLDIFFDLLI